MNISQAKELYSYIITYRACIITWMVTDDTLEVWQYCLNMNTLDGYNTIAISYGDGFLEAMLEWLVTKEEYLKCAKILKVSNGEYTEEMDIPEGYKRKHIANLIMKNTKKF